MDLSDITALVTQQSTALEAFVKRYDDEMREMKQTVIRGNRPGGGTGRQEGPGERKALEQALKAWVAGDQAGTDRALAEYKGMTTGTDPEGGYFVSTQMSDTMTRVLAEVAPIVNLARVIDLRTGDAFEEIDDLETAEAAWVGEIQDRSDTDQGDLAKLRIALCEIYAQPKVSQKLIDVADIDIVGWLTQKIAEAFAVKIADATFNGNSPLRPRGMLTYTTTATSDATRTWGTLEHVPTGHASSFASSNPSDALINLTMTLKTRYRPNARWLMSRSTAGAVRKFKDGQGLYIWQPALSQGQPDSLLGFPVTMCEEMPAVGADAYPIAFGDIRQAYTVIRRPGTKLLTDPYTAKPNVRLYAYSRVGGAVTNFEALKLLKVGTS